MINPTTTPSYRDRLLLLVIYGLAGLVYFFLFEFLRWQQFDTLSFIRGAQFLFNIEGGEILQQRITKPIPLLLPGALNKLFGLSIAGMLLFQNAVLFLLSGQVIYTWGLNVLDNRKAAIGVALILLGCQCFTIYPLFYLSDIWGYFGIIGIGYLATVWTHQQKSWMHWLLLGLLTAVGLLSKESVVVTVVFVSLLITLKSATWTSKLARLFPYYLVAIVPVILVQLILQQTLDVNVVDRVADTNRYTLGYNLNLDYIKQLYRVLDVHWLLVLVGFAAITFCKQWKNPFNLAALLTAVLVVIISPLFPLYQIDRILFMVAPFLILMAGYSFNHFPKTFLLLVISGGVQNVAAVYLIYRYDVGYALAMAALIQLVIVGGARIFEKRNRPTPAET